MVWFIASFLVFLTSCVSDGRNHRSYVISEAPPENEVQPGSVSGSKF